MPYRVTLADQLVVLGRREQNGGVAIAQRKHAYLRAREELLYHHLVPRRSKRLLHHHLPQRLYRLLLRLWQQNPFARCQARRLNGDIQALSTTNVINAIDTRSTLTLYLDHQLVGNALDVAHSLLKVRKVLLQDNPGDMSNQHANTSA